jgi:exodeoxyribonuclease VII small subunit
MDMAKKEKEEEKFSLEKKLKELRALVDKMQGGSQGFDENVEMFRNGTQLIRDCRAFLDESELLIRKLVEEAEGEEEDFDA